MNKYALNVCEKCKRKDLVYFSQVDINYALDNGGLFTKILDHGDHVITLKIDANGSVRREKVFLKDM